MRILTLLLGLIPGVLVLDDATKIDFLAGLAGTNNAAMVSGPSYVLALLTFAGAVLAIPAPQGGGDVRAGGRAWSRSRRHDHLGKRVGLGDCGTRARDLCLRRVPSEAAQGPADDAGADACFGRVNAIPSQACDGGGWDVAL